MSQQTKHEVDWSHSSVPDGASFLYYECMECGHTITCSPKRKTIWMPSIYCDECEHGPPYRRVKVKFHDGTVVERP